MGYPTKLMFRRVSMGATRSRKQFRKDLDTIVEYSAPLGESHSEEESNSLNMPRRVP